MEKDIYKLDLFEEKILCNNQVVTEVIKRVPGGWIYIYVNHESTTSSFIPYSQEFKENDNPKLFVELQRKLANYFKEKGINEFYASAIDIKTKFFNDSNIDIIDIRRVLKKGFNMKPKKVMRYRVFGKEEVGRPFKFSRENFI